MSPPGPGRKRVDVTLVIHTYAYVPEAWDEEAVRFYVEENHCLGNYLTQIQSDEAEAAEEELGPERGTAGVCQLCSFAEAYVGHMPFPTRDGTTGGGTP